jgi:uncharacterized membrane protein
MNDLTNSQPDAEKLHALKRLTATVYLCQLLSFAFAGVPLLIGVSINFMNRNDVKGTWLESHFNWQIQTVWMTLAGFALAGLTLETGFGVFILLPTVLLLVYRIVVGWNALNADRPIKESDA